MFAHSINLVITESVAEKMAPLTNVFLAATLSFANIVSLVSAAPQSSYVPLTSPNDQLYKRTLDPATSNTKGKCPGSTNCSAAKVSDAIQAAECSHNTRVSGTQTFAAFTTEHQYDSAHGAPYGSCAAYTCAAPTDAEMTDIDADCWTFFWE